MADLTQDTAVRKLIADVEAMTRRVKKLASEVPIEYRPGALLAMGRVNRDREDIVHAYNDWDESALLAGILRLLNTQRVDFEDLQPYPLGSEADREITELSEAIRLDWYQLRDKFALTTV